jgi:hypothetical protein
MSKDEIEPIEEIETRFDKIKDVVKRNWKPFVIGVGTTTGIVVIASVTCYVTRGRKIVIVSKVPLLGELIPNEGRNIIMNRPIFKKSPIYNVTNNFGAPVNRLTRVVKCVETGQTTTAINHMAADMDLSASHISRHLDYPEMYPSVKGYHFNHMGYAIPAR